MTELNRDDPDDEGRRHLAKSQFFVVRVGEQEIRLQLAGVRACGEANRFAYKHILDTSGKPGVTAKEKAKRRLMHRTFPTGDIPGTKGKKWHGDKPEAKASLSHAQKYGQALQTHLNEDKAKKAVERYDVKNTVIDLSTITLAEALLAIAEAFVKANIDPPKDKNPANANSKVIKVVFSENCVLTTDMYFNATAKNWGENHYYSNNVNLVGARPYPFCFEIYHLGNKIP